MGESRKEYVARKMSGGRKSVETTDTFLRITKEAADLAGDLLVAVDQEICGICRLHNLIPAFPGIDELASYDAGETGGLSEKRLYEAGAKIRALAKKFRI